MICVPLSDNQLGCASYLLGDEVTNVGLVIDPLEAVGAETYVLTAQEVGLTLTAVFETHVHADHRSCARALQNVLQIPLRMHRGAPLAYSFEPVGDGQRFELGHLELTVWETPGHTPDSISLVVRDRRRGPEPWLVFTGDALFVGDVGRPDLVDVSTAAVQQAARHQFQSIRRLLTLPDFVEVWPAHFGASQCGGLYMDRKMSSTIGYERRFNRLAAIAQEEAFVHMQNQLLKPPPADAVRIRAANLGWTEIPMGTGAERG